MAGRSAVSDPLQNFRFHARMAGPSEPVAGIPGTSGADVLQPEGTSAGYIAGGGAEAGFMAITSPSVTVEEAIYREGIQTYSQVYPGVPSMDPITMTRGTARYDTAFLSWVLAAIEGDEYRADVVIYHVQRPRRTLERGKMAAGALELTDANSKRYILRNAFPLRVKVAGDLDSSASDVSVAEMDVRFERFDVELPTA